MEHKTNWKNQDIVKAEDMNRIEGNINELKTEFDNLQIGGRNLARGTSSEYAKEIIHSGGTNRTTQIGKAYLNGLKVGDTLTVRLLYKYSDIVSEVDKKVGASLQGHGNVTGWGAGSFYAQSIEVTEGNGEYELVYSFKITEDHLKNEFWYIALRHDNIASGSSTWKMLKVEKGTKATDWSYAPEDITPDNIGAINVNKITDRLDVTEDGFVLGGKAGKSLQDQITDTKNNKLDKTGGTVTGRLYLEKGFNVVSHNSTTENGAGLRGYVNIAQLKIVGGYCDSPIEFKVTRRGCSEMTTLTLWFKSSNTVDPGIASFTYKGKAIDAHLYKSDTSIWDLYVNKTEGYDCITIVDLNMDMHYQGKKINITYPGKFVETLPSDTIKATLYNQASTSLVADKLTTARNVTVDGHFTGKFDFDGSKDVNFKLYNKNSMCRTENTKNYTYHRIAKLDKVAGNYRDDDVILMLHCPYRDRFGIIEVGCRREGSTSYQSKVSLRWIVRSGFDADVVTVAYSKDYNNTYVDLFFKHTYAHDNCIVSILDSSCRQSIDSNWVLVNSYEVADTTETNKLTSYECWKTIEEAGTELHGQNYTNIDVAFDSGVTNFANKSPLLSLALQRPTDANIELGKYNGVSTMIASSSMTSNKPDGINAVNNDGVILNLGWDTGANYGSQLAVGNSSNPHIAIRGCHESKGWDKKWTHILDDNNFKEYVTPSAIGAVDVNKITDKLDMTEDGFVLGGKAGKALQDQITGVENNLDASLDELTEKINGFVAKKTEFLDGTIKETSGTSVKTTTFLADGSIKETLADGGESITKVTRFLEDGSIEESIEEESK